MAAKPSYDDVYRRSLQDPAGFWGGRASFPSTVCG